MIPSDELERFAACARDAWDLAAQGRVAEGYAVLDLGLTWAETPALNPFTGEQSAPDTWGAELIALYQSELARYAAAHCLTLGTAYLARQAQFTCEDARALRDTARSLREQSAALRRRALGLEQLVQRVRDLPPARPGKRHVH